MPETSQLLESLEGQPIAVETLNTLVLHTVALGQLRVKPLDLEHPKRSFELELVPVENAYLVCVQHTVGGAAVPPLQPLRIGRTNNLGWLIEREDADIHAPVERARRDIGSSPFGVPLGESTPVPAQDQLLLDSLERRTLYWCQGKERFEALYRALRDAPHQPPAGFEGTGLVFLEIEPDSLEGLELVDVQLRARISRYLLRGEQRGTVAETRAFREIALFDVTPPALRALYVSELVQWYTVQAMKKGMEHWKVLARIKNLADITAHNAPDADLDPLLKKLARPGSRARDVLEHYRDFVWQCVMGGVEKEDLRRALQIHATAPEDELLAWRKFIEVMRDASKGRILHPCLHPNAIDEDRLLNAHHLQTLTDYHDVYKFGRELNAAGVSAALTASMQEISAAGFRSTELIRQQLAGPARHDLFLIQLDLYTSHDTSQRLELLTRYANVATSCGYEFWEPFNSYLPHQWAALEPYTKWISAVSGGLAEALRHFFSRGLEVYELDLDKANQALTTFYRYHLTSLQQARGPIFEETLPALQTKVRVDLGGRSITVISEQRSSRFRFTEGVIPMQDADLLAPGDQLARPQGYAQRVRGKRYRRAVRDQRVVVYDVQVPIDLAALRAKGSELPAVLATAASALNVAAGLLAAKERLAEGDIEAWLDLGQNSLQLFESSVALRTGLHAATGRLPSAGIQELARFAGRGVAVVDGARNAYAGFQVLYGDDDAIIDELRRGNELRAVAVGAKGALQFTTGATGAAYGAAQLLVLGSAEATGFLLAAAGPVGLALAVGTVLIAGIELALVATSEFGEHVEALRDGQENGREGRAGRTGYPAHAASHQSPARADFEVRLSLAQLLGAAYAHSVTLSGQAFEPD